MRGRGGITILLSFSSSSFSRFTSLGYLFSNVLTEDLLKDPALKEFRRSVPAFSDFGDWSIIISFPGFGSLQRHLRSLKQPWHKKGLRGPEGTALTKLPIPVTQCHSVELQKLPHFIPHEAFLTNCLHGMFGCLCAMQLRLDMARLTPNSSKRYVKPAFEGHKL